MGRIIAIAVGVAVALGFVGYTVADAHGSGLTLESVVDGGFIDIGVSATELTNDNSVVFDFGLYDTEGGEPQAFTDVWVRLVRDDATVFASGIYNARLGGALMTYHFPYAGDYELIARFQNDGTAIATGTFDLTVADTRSSTHDGWAYAIAGAVGAVFALVLSRIIRRRPH